MNAVIYKLLKTLKDDAWFPESESTIIRNITDNAMLWTNRAFCCVFPESGCGYHEWRAVCMLQEIGWTLKNVVLMDANSKPAWKDTWQKLAYETDVNLTSVDSYEELNKWMQTTSEPILVMYINGSMNFSRYTCGSGEQAVMSRKAAINFWQQCHQKAVNPPVNFVNISTLQPGNSSTWEQLANIHTLSIIALSGIGVGTSTEVS